LANGAAVPVTPIAETPPANPDLDPRAGFASGLFITLGNPGVIFFFLALLPAVTDLTHLTLREIALMSLLLVGASCAVFAVVILVAALTRRHVLVGGKGRWADYASGALLVLAGLWLIWDGGSKLLEHFR
jgi:threonine/homoserine/homoserine lactone efflux protein